jgi:DoxX-like protein
MYFCYIMLVAVTVIANVGIAIADLVRAKFVVANSAEVRVPSSLLPLLATLKLAGAAGLIAGVLGWKTIGLAAAVGLVLFFVGAVIAHVRARVYHNIAFPAGYLSLAIAVLSISAANGFGR